ncbi:hypothetical protein J4461_04295 [Candidatus Pacearchaeota archaeon]|nr:hypothetical protein [Candidatus Pacearchaeota archaeon]
MKRLKFSPQGKLIGVDGSWASNSNGEDKSDELFESPGELKTSSSLGFLNIKDNEQVKDESGWSLYSEGKKLEPLKFSNGKTQEDVVNEVISAIEKGNKVVFIHGVCGTGKSAIALNIARKMGKASIVVPVKGLQRQYEEDYTSKKYLIKPDGRRLGIAMITGRENHDSLIKPGTSCADPFLPETIKITEKNMSMLKEFYNDNPFITHKADPTLKVLRRISIAPANPYWSPIVRSGYELPLRDARKKRYKGLTGKEFIFYHRKEGCSYYDQYLAYINADVIIFNSAKYLIEGALDRRPECAVDIIDEADDFLDGFSTQDDLNITRLGNSIQTLNPDNYEVKDDVDACIELIQLEEKNKQALGVDENRIYSLNETKIGKIFMHLLRHPDLEAEASLDDMSYINSAIDTAKVFRDFAEDTYVTYRKKDNDLVAQLVTTNLSKKFEDLMSKCNAVVMMSGTLHSKEVLKNVYGIKEFVVVEAETLQQGSIDIHRTGKEIDCRYSNFTSKKHSREDYLRALSACLDKSRRPVLVHVQAFEDLPSDYECQAYGVNNVMSKEKLIALQKEDKTGKAISLFKSGLSDVLFTTKCSRGVDFPGEMCNSVVFTKYTNPNKNGVFWRVLEKTHRSYYWDFYHDKARREFLQRLYRAIRSKDDHVYVLSPDIRVLETVRELQNSYVEKSNIYQ